MTGTSDTSYTGFLSTFTSWLINQLPSIGLNYKVVLPKLNSQSLIKPE